MSHILIVYASHYGQTRKIAIRIAEVLRQEHHEVVLADARATEPPPPEPYDVVVLGSRVEAGRHASEILAYIRMHREQLGKIPTAFFSVSMAAARPGAGPDPDAYLEATFHDLGWTPTCSVAFAGGLPYRRYGWFIRFLMKRISRSAGNTTDTSRNHEMTDWDAVRRFSEELASLTRPERAASRR